jgi:hypothetical protein
VEHPGPGLQVVEMHGHTTIIFTAVTCMQDVTRCTYAWLGLIWLLTRWVQRSHCLNLSVADEALGIHSNDTASEQTKSMFVGQEFRLRIECLDLGPDSTETCQPAAMAHHTLWYNLHARAEPAGMVGRRNKQILAL